MELRETIAQEVIYNLSVLYKVLLVTGVFLLFTSAFMYLLNSNISSGNEFISESTMQTSFITSVLYIATSIVFMCFRNIVRIKTRKFRTKHCRI
jgi:hypothetical protein